MEVLLALVLGVWMPLPFAVVIVPPFAGARWLIAAVTVAAGTCWYAVRNRRPSPATG